MSLFASLGGEDVDDSLWGDGGLFSNNPVQDLLDREEGFTLEELLEEDELIQEVKHLNTKLIDFLSLRSTVAQLTAYVTRDDTKDEEDVMAAATQAEAEMDAAAAALPTGGEAAVTGLGGDADDAPAFMNGMPQSVMQILHEREKLGRFAYTASEIFCCEVPGVNCHLLEDAATVAKRLKEGGDGSEDVTPEQLPGSTAAADAAAVAVAAAATAAAAAAAATPTSTEDQATTDANDASSGPLISSFFQILHRPTVSPRTAGYLEKIVDVFLGTWHP